MSRQFHEVTVPTWRDDKLADLAKQLTYSPAEKRLEQVRAAAALAHELDPLKDYPWEFILFRITGYRPKEPNAYHISGKVLRADLSVFVEFLSDTLALRVEDEPEPALSLEEVTAQFKVSGKTIQRWRRQGLIAMRYTFADGRRRLGFLRSAVQAFASANAQRVARSASFKQLSEEEKQKIIRYARRLAVHCRCCLKDISRRIGRKLNRAPETIRYTIRKYDQEHPESAIFPPAGTLADTDRARILDAVNRGVPVDCLAARYCQPRTGIADLVTQDRIDKLRRAGIEYIPNPLFEHPDADTIILEVLPREALARATETVAAGQNAKAADLYVARTPRDLPPSLAAAFRDPVMPQELETDAFRRMNYLKYKAAGRLAALQPGDTPELAAIEALLAQANALKNQLLQANLRVAIHVARKHQRLGRDLLELFSDATIWLMRAVERYDFARPTRFSTYASYAIMKNFARDRAEQLTRRDRRFVTGQEEVLSQIGAAEGISAGDQMDRAHSSDRLRSVLEQLSTRDRELLAAHYGLDRSPMSLAELGAHLGLTKSRVRQLEARALSRLRKLLESKPA